MPPVSVSAEQAADHLGRLAAFAGTDLPAASASTRATLGRVDLLADLRRMDYGAD